MCEAYFKAPFRVMLAGMTKTIGLLVVVLSGFASAQCPTDRDIEASKSRALELLRAARNASEMQRSDAQMSETSRLTALKRECDRVAEAKVRKEKADAEAELARVKLEAREKEEEERRLLAASRDEKFRQLVSDKKNLAAMVSALICIEKKEESAVLAAIKQERDNSKIAGVVSLAELKELQDMVVFSRKMQKGYADSLVELKVATQACQSKMVKAILHCREFDDPDCQPPVSDMEQFLPRLDGRPEDAPRLIDRR